MKTRLIAAMFVAAIGGAFAAPALARGPNPNPCQPWNPNWPLCAHPPHGH